MLILTVNCGSSSLKVDIVSVPGEEAGPALAAVHVRDVGASATASVRLAGGPAEPLTVELGDYRETATSVLAQLESRGLLKDVDAVGHRVVHGGAELTAPVLLTTTSLAAIEAVAGLAPLHNGPALEAIAAAREVLPRAPQVATFDTAFFRDLPAVASTYAIPLDMAARLGIRRYGFHGLAHRSMAQRFAGLTRRDDARLVTLQLGSGCSAAALRGGLPVDTSMGFTPLEGLVMGTRSGDLDPSLPLYMAEKTGTSVGEVEALLNDRSGLAGLAGDSNMSRLVERQAAGDAAAALAVELFCYRVRKYVGAYAAVLGGLDGLVFGGGIGEGSADVRERVCAGFEWLGLELDAAANRRPPQGERRISKERSAVQVWVAAVDEAAIIASDTAAFLGEDRCGGADDA